MTGKNQPGKTLVLFTHKFPFDPVGETTFIAPEIKRLGRRFARTIVVPSILGRERIKAPEGFTVEEDFARRHPPAEDALARAGRAVSACRSALLYRELRAHPLLLARPSALGFLLSYVAFAEYTSAWLKKFIRREKLDLRRTVFYSYWASGITLGVSLARDEFPGIRLVSRLHGSDIYEERYPFRYLPLRKETLTGADGLFPDSAAGRDYLQRKYAELDLNLSVALLGVEDPGFTARGSDDGVFRAASCSYMVGIKRLDLLAEGMAEAARLRPEKKFEWHHLGDGPERDRISGLARRIFPANAAGFFPGRLPAGGVMDFYRNRPLDVFLNVSSSEGTPVAIMEAQSAGLPVIAAAVGGIPEIVTGENGLLLEPDPGPGDIARALLALLDDPALRAGKGRAGKSNWAGRYSAERNYSEFAEALLALLPEEGSPERSPAPPGHEL